MTEPAGRVLIIDDEPDACRALERILVTAGFRVDWRTRGEEGFELATAEEIDAVLLDLNIEDTDELALCARIGESVPELPVIVMTAYGSLDRAVAAMRAGAYDLLTKPFDAEVVLLSVQRAQRHRALRREVRRLRREVRAAAHFEELSGTSAAMRGVYDLIDRVAELDTSVLITGERGTGKKLVARALHKRSSRKDGPFVTVDCAARSEPLLESELFGHAKGAVTEAKGARAGLFREATGGTLFLDEIGDLPLGLQPKLLRALQEKVVRPVGSNVEQGFDVRIVAATHRDLETEVEERRFREDLFYRINVVHIELPPLRARGSDILILAQDFIARYAASTARSVRGLSMPAAEKLLAYPWPGNVRGLQNCIERAVSLARFDEITVDDLPEKIRRHNGKDLVVAADDPSELVTMDQVEKRYVLRVLESVQGNKKVAAQILGFDRATLYRKLARYGVTGSEALPPPTARRRHP